MDPGGAAEAGSGAWLGVIGTLLGVVFGAFGSWLATKRGTLLGDRLTRHRERQLGDGHFRRTVLADRIGLQRAALIDTERLAAEAAHSLQDEAEIRRLRERLIEAFGTSTFADKVVASLDENAEAAAGNPSVNAGLSLVACTKAMREVILLSEKQLMDVPHEDAMLHFDKALEEERAAFGALWAEGSEGEDHGEPET